MAKVWQLDNFSLGMHTEPGKQRGGSRYAADKNNLQVDGDGWLRLRSNFKKVGPDGENITGLAASNTHLFILREGGKLYFRPLSDLDDETEITDVPDLEGRISVISAFRDYIMLTSEGEDQGYWVDFREDKDRVANTLGIVAPSTTEILPDGSATLAARTLREGSSLTFQLVSKVNALDDTVFPEIRSWSDLNLISAVATLRYDNGTTEVTMVSGQDYDEVTTDELTLNTDSLLSGGNFQVFLSDDSITGNKIDKFSIDIALTSTEASGGPPFNLDSNVPDDAEPTALVAYFVKTKKAEFMAHHHQVTQSEIDQYLTLF